MKKLLIIVCLFISAFSSYAQPLSYRANSSFTVADYRLYPVLNLFLPKYLDTTQANIQKGIDSCGAIIFCYSTNTIWFRQCSPKMWVQITGGGGGGTVTGANQGTSLNGSTVQLGGRLGVLTTPDTIYQAFQPLMLYRDVSSGLPAYPTYKTTWSNPVNMEMSGADGGNISFVTLDSNATSFSSFSNVSFYEGFNRTFLGGMIYHHTPGDKHFDIFDGRNGTQYIDIQWTGVSTIDWRPTGETYMGLIGSHRVGIGKGLGTLAATLDVKGTIAVSDSAKFFSRILANTDSIYGKRSDGTLGAISPSSIIGTVPTLQNVFNKESGTAVMTLGGVNITNINSGDYSIIDGTTPGSSNGLWLSGAGGSNTYRLIGGSGNSIIYVDGSNNNASVISSSGGPVTGLRVFGSDSIVLGQQSIYTKKRIDITPDSLFIENLTRRINTRDKFIVVDTITGKVSYSDANASGITVGTTTVTGGTNGFLLGINGSGKVSSVDPASFTFALSDGNLTTASGSSVNLGGTSTTSGTTLIMNSDFFTIDGIGDINIGDYSSAGNGTLITISDASRNIQLSSSVQIQFATGLMVPRADNATDLGSTSKQFKDVYIAGNVTISSLSSTPNKMIIADAAGVLSTQTIPAGTVTSVSGTTNRITSTGGATPVIDISSTFENLLAKLAASNTFTGTTNKWTLPTTTGTTTTSGMVITANSLTSGTAVNNSTTSLTSGTLENLISTSTALAAGNELLNIAMSGANGTNAITATGARISVTNTNATSGTNVGLSVTASGAATSNIAIAATGMVGISTTTPAPNYMLDVQENRAGVFAANITNNSSTGSGLGVSTFSTSTESILNLLSGASGSTSRMTVFSNGTVTLTPGTTTGTTTTSALVQSNNNLTSGTEMYLTSNSITSGKMIDISITGTAGLTNQTGVNVSLSGANGTGAQTTYAGQFSNTHTGTSVNVGAQFIASGGSTNLAILVASGNGRVAIGQSTANASLDVVGTAILDAIQTSSVGGSSSFFAGSATGFTGTTAAAAQYLSSTTVDFRVLINGTTSSTGTSGRPFANFEVAGGLYTEPGSGNIPLIAGASFLPPIITGAAGTVTNGATVYIDAPTTATVSGGNFSLLIGSGNAQFTNGNLTLGTAGNKLNIATGSNASVGASTLSSGTVTVSTTAVTSSSLIFVVYNTPSGTLASGLSAPTGSIVNGTSFVINSLTTAGLVNTLDNSTVRWWILN